MTSEVDLLMQMHQTLENLQLKYELTHVKGHQDNENDYEKLSWSAKLNIHCDHIASAKLKTIKSSPTIPFNPTSSATLTLNNTTVTHHILAQIRHHHNSPPLQLHLQERNGWNNTSFNNINWESFNTTVKSLPL